MKGFINFMQVLRSSIAAVAPPKAMAKPIDSVKGKSASAISSELKNRGGGSMSKGVTKTQQKGYWQGRADQKKLDKNPK